MSNRRVLVSILALLIAVLPAKTALAQGPSNTGHVTTSGIPSSSPSQSPDAFDSGFGNGQIRGTIRTANGHAVSGATIEARDTVHGTLITSVHSAADGSFNLSNLPTGRYEVTASSGVEQARERVEVGRIGETTVDLLLSNKTPTGNTSDSSISFAQYKVPAKARSLYEKAVQFMARDKFDEALEKVNASLDIFPKFAEALTLHGVIQERAGKSEAAIADYRLAIQSDPKYPLPYITMASVLNSTGRFAESLSFLGQAEHIAPNMWQISYESARSSLGKDDFAAALRSIDRASELHGGTLKETAEMHLVRGYALIGLSNVQKAKDEVQAFLTREPKGHVADDAREVLRRLDNGTMSASN